MKCFEIMLISLIGKRELLIFRYSELVEETTKAYHGENPITCHFILNSIKKILEDGK